MVLKKKDLEIIQKKKTNEIYENFLLKKSIKIDSREVKKGDIFFALKGENFDGNDFAEEVLKKNPSLIVMDNKKKFEKRKKKEKIILVENSITTLQNLAKRYRADLKIPFLAITGSNGKTTTKELLKKVLSQKFNVLATDGNLNNHIGVPLTILSIKSKHNFVIIEMGASGIGEIRELCKIAQPNFGLITNIGVAHIGKFKNFENIIKTKKELFDWLGRTNGKVFVNKRNEIIKKISRNIPGPNKIYIKGAEKLESNNFLKIKINEKEINTKLIGDYNIFNLEYTFAVGKFFKIPVIKIISSLEKYKPMNNRSQIFRTKNKNDLILDCYNANPSSMTASIESFKKQISKKKKMFILGDMKELGKYSKKEHQNILNILMETGNEIFLVGEEFMKLKKESAKNKEIIFFKDVLKLISHFKKKQIKNKMILMKASKSVNLKKIVEEKTL